MITKIMKNALAAQVLRMEGGTCNFVSRPATSELRQVFKNLMDPKEDFYFAYFSDDSALSVRMPDGSVRMFNIDIKSCDCSHTAYIFQMLIDITPPPMREGMRTLVDQLRLPFEVVSTQNKRHKVRFQPHTAKLQSGSTITTLINNLACLVIIKAIRLHGVYTGPGIQAAGVKCGYQLTVEECRDYSQLQFLKHSPVYDTLDRLQPLLNLGVLMRSIGTCKGDLPGRGDIETRARQFNGGLLRGMYPRADFPLVNRLKANTLTSTEKVDAHISNLLRYKVVNDDLDSFSVSSAEVYRRYSHCFEGAPLRPDEYAELDEEFGRLSTWMHYASPATDKIFRMDYGLRVSYTRRCPNPAR
jgi:hypothetical protein